MRINKIQIVNALTWAGTMVGCGYMLRGFENSVDIINILFTSAIIHFLLLSEIAQKFSKTRKINQKSKGSNH